MPIQEMDLSAADAPPPFDYEHNGLDDFLVLNGRPWPTEGPVQLIAFFPDSDWVTSTSRAVTPS